MSVTINNIITLVNSFSGEKTEERISDEERMYYITEAVADVKQKMKGDMSNMTYSLDYVPGIYYYKIDQSTYNVLAAGDVRVDEDNNGSVAAPFFISSADKIAEDITNGKYGRNYALDRYDGDLYLVLSYMPSGSRELLTDTSSLTGVTAVGDATTLELDTNEAKHGTSIKMNVDVSGSVDNKAGINIPIDFNLTSNKDITTLTGSVYIKDASQTTSVSIKLQTDSSNYYLFDATTPHNNSSFKDGWNMVVVKWEDATEIGTPDITDINNIELVVNYNLAQTDTVIRFDNFYLSKPTKLKFHYLSYSVGKNAAGDEISNFSSETDIPYFSGQYDNLKFAIARQAAAMMLYDLRLYEEAQIQEYKAASKLKEVMNLIPSSHRVESKSFRPYGINFRRK